MLKCVVGLARGQLSLLAEVSSSSFAHPYDMNNTEEGIMEIGTDTTARIAADILTAALESKAVTTRGDTKECVQQIAEAFTVIHRAVLEAGNGTPP